MLKIKKMKPILPWVAVIAAILVVAGLVYVTLQRQSTLAGRVGSRPSVEAAVSHLQERHPTSLDAAGFQELVKRVEFEPYVAYVWLIAPDGEVVLSNSQGASRSGNVEQNATAETRHILAGLPADALSSEQRLMLLAASAIQAEGEHNDVYNHIVRPIRDQEGNLVGLVGVAYSITSFAGTPSSHNLFVVGYFFWLIALVIYWLSLALWVFIDARERGERAWVWGMFTLIGNLVALIAYILARNPQKREVGM